MSDFAIPPFRSHPLVRGGHAQTLAGAYLPGRHPPYRARRHHVRLDDGDQLVLHDDCPEAWQPGDRSTLLIHGLGGSHTSGYMQRIARKLNARGVRAFRMDLRGAGAGMGLARLPYHSGRAEDARAALEAIARHLPQSPTTLVGFSLGANLSLKLLGDPEHATCGNLDSAMAVNPPMDLAACSRQIALRSNRLYDRYFVNVLVRQLRERSALLPDAPVGKFARPPRTLWEFDDNFTAVVCGFDSADDYYARASAAPHLEKVRVPTLVMAAADDPMIPSRLFVDARVSPAVQVHIAEGGGHLGYIGRRGIDADTRWMDWRVVDWVTAGPKGVLDRTAAAARGAADRVS
jgi:predicted alpha/beta-fold hydrolase